MIDEATLKEMEKIEKQKPVEVKIKKSAPKVESNTCWVKCVCHEKPWTAEKPLMFWEDYEISTEEAILLHDKHQVVILKEPKGE